MKASTFRVSGCILVGVGIMAAFLAAAGMDGTSKIMTILALSAAGMCALVSGALLIKASAELEKWEYYTAELEELLNVEELTV